MGYVAQENRNAADDSSIGGARWMKNARFRFAVLSGTALLLLTCNALVVSAQSGRRKSEQTRTPSPIDTSSATKTQQPMSGAGASQKENGKPNGNDDATDVVHISSNLGPVPATVLDIHGSAVTDLRLDES